MLNIKVSYLTRYLASNVYMFLRIYLQKCVSSCLEAYLIRLPKFLVQILCSQTVCYVCKLPYFRAKRDGGKAAYLYSESNCFESRS